MTPTSHVTTRPPGSHDAVIVIPGIMGSELVDVTTGNTLWGLADASWYVSAWTTGQGLRNLQVTDPDPEREHRRVRATRLLRFPAFMPVLTGMEPYTRLMERIAQVVQRPEALRPFPYDWRLPVAHNAALLARVIEAHLKAWRWRAESHGPGGNRARVVLVAHSMGGLLVQELARIPGALDEVRAIITLGTPFLGSLDAVRMLSEGAGSPFPLPRRRLQALARTLPSVYELLPAYRCVQDNGVLRHLAAGDLAVDSDSVPSDRAAVRTLPLPGHRCLVGLGQPTFQSMTLRSGDVEVHHGIPDEHATAGADLLDHSGDGTVYRYSAELRQAERTYVHQSHGALARCKEAMDHVCAVISEDDQGAPLGGGELGLEVPDVVHAGEPFTFAVTGSQSAGASCYVVDLSTGGVQESPVLRYGDATHGGRRAGELLLTEPGLYRVAAAGGSGSPVTRLLLAAGRGDKP
ncbi:lipase/acyltransferase domain-containing protein [Streptomyces sp. DT193]|uniref:lipase/acyltransferase domain-containing protein n=1 Tax=Streptomyces sp. DT193 TaxID=3393418 RepID=UPI003CE70987